MNRFFKSGRLARAKLAAGAFILVEDKILLAKKGYGLFRDQWTLPEGYIEKGESLSEGLCRELTEELNGEIEVGDLIAVRHRRGKENSVYFVFDCRLKNPADIRLNDQELIDYKFFDFRDAIDNSDVYPLVKTLLEKIRQKQTCFKQSKFFPADFGIKEGDYVLYL